MFAIGALFLTGALGASAPHPPGLVSIGSQTADTSEAAAAAEGSIAAIAQQAVPSIVTVEVGEGNGRTDAASVSGSGVVFGSSGYLLTNNHVVEDAGFVRVVFSDGRIYQATVVGTDPVTDIAVLSIPAEGLQAIEFTDMSSVHIGDLAVAIGSPLGLMGGPSVTSGIISAFNRELQVTADRRLFGLVQTDAPITRGSSGGALLDSSGRLIGITTAIGISDVGAEGLGFAVPVSIVQGVAEDLIRDTQVHHAFIGVQVQPAFEEIGQAQVPDGALITGFEAGTGVEKAGAQLGDIITEVNGVKVTGVNDLIALLRTHRAGEAIELTLLRDGETLTIETTLGQLPAGP